MATLRNLLARAFLVIRVVSCVLTLGTQGAYIVKAVHTHQVDLGPLAALTIQYLSPKH